GQGARVGWASPESSREVALVATGAGADRSAHAGGPGGRRRVARQARRQRSRPAAGSTRPARDGEIGAWLGRRHLISVGAARARHVKQTWRSGAPQAPPR